MIRVSLAKGGRWQRRAFTILTNSINSLLLPVFNVIVSFLVIRLASVGLWGEFVNVLIIVQLAVHIIGWGNKEYLLRAFSRNPAQIAPAWQSSLITRLALFLAFIVVAGFVGLSARRLLLVILWCLGLVIYQAHDVLILYRKDFLFSIVVELAGIALLASTVAWQGHKLSLDGLLFFFTVASWLKAGAFLLRFRRQTMGHLVARFDSSYFGLAFPFFLLGFSGMLQSRTDLYAVNYFLPRSEVGQYQVFINFMLYLQSIAAFILMPFVKTIYRLRYSTILKLSARLFALGAVLMPPALVAVYLVLTYLYHLHFSPAFMLLGGLLVLPAFFYLPIIYALYKADRQSLVLAVNGLGIAVNLALNLLLLPRLGMMGGVTAAAAAQWSMLGVYLIQSRALRDDHPFAVPKLP